MISTAIIFSTRVRRFLVVSIISAGGLGIALLSFVFDGTPVHSAGYQVEIKHQLFAPSIQNSVSITPISPPLAISSTMPISVPLLLEEANGLNVDLALNKIGFHTGTNGNSNGLDEWMESMDAAGAPIFLKSVDNAEPLYKAQLLAKESGVPHVLVYRKSGLGFDLPNYDASPEDAAEAHWILHRNAFPPELDPSMVWIETVNEVDRARSEWLAQFALATAKLAIEDGYKWAAFGWASGTPEPVNWEGAEMLNFLRFAASNPEQAAIALHEYSYEVENIGAGYPFLLGRFQELFNICDQNGIRRPTVLITEWGWEYENVPDPTEAMNDIKWAAWMYAAYPQIKGAAIWYLGGNFGEIANQAQKLIAPVLDYGLTNYFHRPRGTGPIDQSLYHPIQAPQ